MIALLLSLIACSNNAPETITYTRAQVDAFNADFKALKAENERLTKELASKTAAVDERNKQIHNLSAQVYEAKMLRFWVLDSLKKSGRKVDEIAICTPRGDIAAEAGGDHVAKSYEDCLQYGVEGVGWNLRLVYDAKGNPQFADDIHIN